MIRCGGHSLGVKVGFAVCDDIGVTDATNPACGISIHPRCVTHVKLSCPGTQTQEESNGMSR